MRLTALVLAAVCAGMPGCNRPDGARATPEVVRAVHGVSPACRATLNVRVQPEGGEAMTLTLHLWADRDGALRLKVAKLDVDVLDLHVAPDGAYRAWAPRSREQSAGRLGEAGTPALLARLALVAGELTAGPLPPGVGAAVGREGLVWTGPDGTTTLTAGADGLASAKHIVHPTLGAIAIVYSQYHNYDGLHRARRLQLTGLGMDATAIVRELNPVPAISPAGMRVEPAADAPVVPIAVLLEHLA